MFKRGDLIKHKQGGDLYLVDSTIAGGSIIVYGFTGTYPAEYFYKVPRLMGLLQGVNAGKNVIYNLDLPE